MRAERRRRGRDIRRARRLAAGQTTNEVMLTMHTRSFSRSLAAHAASLAATVEALVRIYEASIFTRRVIFERFDLAYLLPRAGTRRQLLHQGRAPKGRR